MDNIFNDITQNEYKYGFSSDIDTEIIPVGLNEDIVRLISAKKREPEWLLDFRLKAYSYWLTMKMPEWAHLNIPPIDYQGISYYAVPKKANTNNDGNAEIDPELLKTFDKLGIPLHERNALSGMAVDAVLDSSSVKTTFKENLAELGIIFCSFSEAVEHHPIWCVNILARLCLIQIIILRLSTVLFLAMALLFTFQRVCVVRWSFPHILE